MKLNKKIIVLLAFVSLLLSIVTVQDTYAKYVAHVDGTTDISIARWRILLNDFDVRNQLTSSNLITPVLNGNTYIASNVIAPTATGYFVVEIDASDTDVSFTYTITIENDDDTLVDDLEITNCYINGQQVNHNNGTITGTVGVNDISKVKELYVYFQWNDGNGQTMDNEDDTLTTTAQDPLAKVAVTAHFIQNSSNS